MKRLFFVSLCCSSTLVVAQSVTVPTYNTVYRENGFRSFMVDPGTIEKQGNNRRFVQVIDLASASNDGVRSRRSIEEADCGAGKTRSVEEQIFDGPIATGKILRESKEVSEWSVEESDSPGEKVLKFVCAR